MAQVGGGAPASRIAAARYQKRLTQPGYLVLAAHLFDPGIPLGGNFGKDAQRLRLTLLHEFGVLLAQPGDSPLRFSTLRTRFCPGGEVAGGSSLSAQR